MLQVVLWALPALLHAQLLEPQYKFTLRFEDALGNRDSVIMGFDDRISKFYNPEFGETNIAKVPFDSVFEVRGGDSGEKDFQSKTVIGAYFQWMCDDAFANYQMVSLRAKHFPVTMSWDSAYFQDNYCLEKSLITRTFGYVLSPDFFDPKATYMARTSSLRITRTHLQYTDEGWLTTNVFDMENGTRDTVYNFFVGISPFDRIIGTSETSDLPLQLSPNPAGQTLRIKVPETGGDDLRLLLCDIHGRVVLAQQVSAHQEVLLDVERLLPGLYIVSAFDPQGRRRFTGRVAKQP